MAKKVIATLAPIGPFRDDYSEDDFKKVIKQMREIESPEFPNLDAERVKNMRSACVASVIYGVESQLVADYGRPARGWPASLEWEAGNLGTAFVSNTTNRMIDQARMSLDEDVLSRRAE
jgi:hypothetical protein